MFLLVKNTIIMNSASISEILLISLILLCFVFHLVVFMVGYDLNKHYWIQGKPQKNSFLMAWPTRGEGVKVLVA